MAKTSPLVSIVVPAYNAERFLSEALASVCAQSHSAIEVIVCDDASTDATPRIAKATGDDRVRYLRNEQTLGGYGAMNRGVRESNGEYVAIYHADDVYDPRIVERELAFLLARPEVGAVFCLDRFIDETGREYGRLKLPPLVTRVESFDTALLAENLLRYKNTFLRTPSVMFRRAAFDAVGGFDPEFFLFKEEEDLFVRMRAAGARVRYLPTVRVRHEGGVVASRAEHMPSSVARFAAKHAPRRRLVKPVHRAVTVWGGRLDRLLGR